MAPVAIGSSAEAGSSISVGLQYGIPLDSYVAKFTNMRFEPAGLTDDPDIRLASSVMILSHSR
jgi:hypothetical protein